MLRVSEDGNRRREGYVESYRQLGRSLHELQTAANRIFDAISERTSKEREKLTEISRRIQTAKAKIDVISLSKKALIVTSPSRYPSNCIDEEDFPPLFQYKDEKSGDGFLTKLSLNGGLSREFGKDGTLELFQFFSEENIEHPPQEAQLKARERLNANSFLEDLLEAPKFTSSSSCSTDRDVADITLDPKKQRLPPPPPSLLLHNIPSLRKSKAPKSTTTAYAPAAMKLPGTRSDINHPKKDRHPGPMSDE